MKQQILFIQGGGDGGYDFDKALVASLQKALGDNYDIKYPEIKSDESASDFGWNKQIGAEISNVSSNFILVGHSFGASMILKFLSENLIDKKIKAIFLVATPFWSGNEKWKEGFKLREDFPQKLPKKVPIFFYHTKDDEEIPFSHFEQYREKIKRGIFFEIKTGGHQLNNDLSILAKEILKL
jgi:hypothetical protein